ncbi:hypothetical protein [Saccharopolyspora phatthalungensis]|uniref:Uncharacterized protein n=1 Tax=Saccharopolyspora phatthalungensis TaxID=664693 RepID=A0A840Q6H3_9PSEU|nr:hypothetical protein [Saccharopolyspora phatthalungensis]MBB5156234.1 hypothetical protein [Saccharopolyspora phatthalungensis]
MTDRDAVLGSGNLRPTIMIVIVAEAEHGGVPGANRTACHNRVGKVTRRLAENDS